MTAFIVLHRLNQTFFEKLKNNSRHSCVMVQPPGMVKIELEFVEGDAFGQEHLPSCRRKKKVNQLVYRDEICIQLT